MQFSAALHMLFCVGQSPVPSWVLGHFLKPRPPARIEGICCPAFSQSQKGGPAACTLLTSYIRAGEMNSYFLDTAYTVRLHALTLNQVHAANTHMQPRHVCYRMCQSTACCCKSCVYGVPNRPRFFTRKTHPPAPRRPFWAPSGRLGTEGSVVCDGTLPGLLTPLCVRSKRGVP